MKNCFIFIVTLAGPSVGSRIQDFTPPGAAGLLETGLLESPERE